MSSIFTFGPDHKHPLTGESLGRSFIWLPGDVKVSRFLMLHLFGPNWAFQYPDETAAGVQRYRLTRLDWPFTIAALEDAECGCEAYLYRPTREARDRTLIVHRAFCADNMSSSWRTEER